MINKVILMGRLTRDPEMRHTNSGTPVTTFSIAIDNGYGDNKRTDFVNCLAWNKTAEFVSKYFGKGKMIIVIGHITTRSWETQDGKRAYATEVVANEVNFGESKTSPQLNTPQTAAQPPMQDDDDDFTPLDEEDDDLPF
jgi:single-strand DNA-binding protein